MELPWAHLCLLLAASCTLWPATRSFQHVCYLRADNKSLPFAKVDVGLCSHIILGFAAVASDGSLDLDPAGGLQHLASFALLRRRKPELKLMLSVGGGGGNKNFKKMVAGASRTRRFIFSAVSALRAARLDGLDLDWEFPKLLDAVPFVHLLKMAFLEFKGNKRWPLILSVAVPAQSLLVVGKYKVKRMAKYVDFVNLMAYDLNIYTWYTPRLHHNSPLFPRATDGPYFNTLNVASSAKLWAKLGMPKSKIMVGIPTYGLSWVLTHPDRWKVGSRAAGRAQYGGGFVSYAEVLEYLASGAKREYDPEAMVPFLHKDKLWISYDDEYSVRLKALWTLRNGYGGTMTFSLNADDWAGSQSRVTFPLQRAIAQVGSAKKPDKYAMKPGRSATKPNSL
ncbi:chitotriosidase-1-like [Haemaphysalis longicornis]